MEHENAHSEDEESENRNNENAGCNLSDTESNEENDGQERVEAIVVGLSNNDFRFDSVLPAR